MGNEIWLDGDYEILDEDIIIDNEYEIIDPVELGDFNLPDPEYDTITNESWC